MLAIVIPYYNYQYFEDTLIGLSKQTDKRFVVYLGNDNSPNNPEKLIKKYRESLKINYVLFNDNLGSISLVKQWERCIALTKDEPWLMILGDDDVLDQNCVSAFYKNIETLQKNNISLIRYASQYINEQGLPLNDYPLYKHPSIEKATTSFYKNALGQSRSSLSEHIFTRESYLKNGFKDFPMAWYSDDYAWLMFSNFDKIYTINEAIVSVRVTSISITGKNDNFEIKNKATLQFYACLVNECLNRFTKTQQNFILLKYGEVLKKNNMFNLKKAFTLILKLFSKGFFLSGLRIVNRYVKTNNG